MDKKINKSLILNKIKTHYDLDSNVALANFLGITPAAIGNWYNRNTIDYDLIFTKCVDMDKNYLIDDRMLYQDDVYSDTVAGEPKHDYHVTKIIEPKEVTTKLLTWIDPNHEPIPVYDTSADFESISDLLINDKPSFVLLKGHLGCDIVVRHDDSAMYKDFPTRCQLGIKKILNFRKILEPGKPYIIVFDEIRVTRYVFNGTEESALLLRSSDVDLFPDMLVNKNDIKELWRIKSLNQLNDIRLF